MPDERLSEVCVISGKHVDEEASARTGVERLSGDRIMYDERLVDCEWGD